MLTIRKATEADMQLYFEWANDETVRQNSINPGKIIFSDHVNWFKSRLNNPDTIMLLFLNEGTEIGQLRIEIDHENREAIINYSIAKESRGKGFGKEMLSGTYRYFSGLDIKYPLTGFVKPNNIPSISAFIKAGYEKVEGLFPIKDDVYFKFTKNS